jgi:hypothetical protein
MERIFTTSGVGGYRGVPGSVEDSYEAHIHAMMEDSVDYEESYLSGVRETNQKFYNGMLPGIEHDDGSETVLDEDLPINKSRFVSTDVRDTILTVLPSLVRIFANGDEKIAEFVPNTEDQADMAEEQYDYFNYVFFEDNPGWMTLYSLFKDALTVKTGIAKWWTDNDYEVAERTYTNISQEQLQFVIHEVPDIEIVGIEQTVPEVIDAVTVRFVRPKPVHRVMAVPPEEFRINRTARDIETAALVGHETIVPMSDLVQKGYNPDELRDYLTTGPMVEFSEEKQIRNPALIDTKLDEDGVLYGEWYIRVDGDGDGIAELRRICTIGDTRIIVEDEVADCANFALFNADPTPHTAIGDCLADITRDIQLMKTRMMRGQLDNLSEMLNPRTVVNELVTNIEDVLSDDVGAVIRTTGNPNDAVAYTRIPYAGEEIQASINYLDQVRASRTGITEASKGLDPEAMQSTNLVGINAIISGAQERIELIARALAETGLRVMMKGLLKEIVNNPSPERVIKLRGEWKAINPSIFDPSMRVKINPSIGKGTDQIKLQALLKVEQTQMLILERFGVKNPIVTPAEFLNTQRDILAISNIKNFGRYFRPMTEDVIQKMMAQPDEPDPATVLAQAELEKVKKDIIIASGKLEVAMAELENKRNQLDLETAKAEENADFRRDKLNIDSMLEAARIFQQSVEKLSMPPAVIEHNRSTM